MKTPMEIWEDEEHLEKGINKILTGTFFTKRERPGIYLRPMNIGSYFLPGMSGLANRPI